MFSHTCAKSHSSAKTYQKIYEYFNFKIHFGFTATPNRYDEVRLDTVFDKIIFERDLIWEIKNRYLSNIQCKRFYINIDLKRCKKSSSDYQIQDLEKIIDTDENSDAIGKIYKDHATTHTLIFAVSVAHCYSIQKQIENSVVIDSNTKNRCQLIDDFTDGKINCIINCMIFTEGTDIPKIKTIIMARPTQNISLYQQMIGRGLRLCPDKEILQLIDCCGNSTLNVCTAPSLLGINPPDEAYQEKSQIEGDLFDLPEIIKAVYDKPQYWLINYKIVKLFEKKCGYNFHGIDFYQMPNGSLTLKIPNVDIRIDVPNEIGFSNYYSKQIKVENVKMQKIIDGIYKHLTTNHMDSKYLWDLKIKKRWGSLPATTKQKTLCSNILQKFKDNTVNVDNLTKLQASQIINRLNYKGD